MEINLEENILMKFLIEKKIREDLILEIIIVMIMKEIDQINNLKLTLSINLSIYAHSYDKFC